MNTQTLRTWWSQRPPREQTMLSAAVVLILAALMWTIAIAPAWRTVKAYPAQRAALDAQLQQMQTLQAQATALQSRPALAPQAAQAGLQAAVTGLGPRASLLILNQQATVTLKGVEAETLARWLAVVRLEARMLPTQAQWRRDGRLWSGTVTFTLPGG